MVKPGYEQTEVGVIPDEWDVEFTGNLGTVIRGASPRPKGDRRYYGGPVPRLMVEDVTRDGKYVTPIVDSLTLDGEKLSRPCKKGTLTFVCSGDVGVPSFLAVDACIHDGFLALVKIADQCHDDYLYHYIGTQRDRLDNAGTHGGVFKNLTTEVLRSFPVALPPKPEQRLIAEVLSDVDGLIAGLEALIAKKRDMKTAAKQQLLTGKTRLPGFGEGVGMKQSELGEIPEDWEVAPLVEKADFIHGKAHEQSIVEDGPFTVVNSKFVSTNGNVQKFSSVSHRTARIGDVLMVLSDLPNGKALSKCYLTPQGNRFAVNQRVCIFRGKNAAPGYLYFVLNRNKYFLALDDGVSQTHILNDDVRRCLVQFPTSFDEQECIAETLLDMDSEIAGLGDKLRKFKDLKQGMMQELLTGRTRLI